ncbi:MAG: ABC transporter ATP-binding protein [Leptotrichiaceae bacterium]|jgi:ABC-type multidrug transport system fused ATPase/permease subunit|nr:ABC transporter ATP-binding protein [Leptotrichiaceae bacterium]MBP7026880.1 ABC transporter ATP-binding protein [Leptotrichiaceae bacterium]MBP8637521.1 ABC transporter ATP-binding protein [Leptotrichiaceae bacterium]MBP9876486.1 ABC transporter ATP-binding protein [Leptotrichiaceae bacterium]
MGTTRESLFKLKRYIKKFYSIILLNMFLSALTGIISSAPILLIKRLFDKGIIGRAEKDILYASLAMIGLALIAGILMYYNSQLSGTISTGIYKNIIDDLYSKIQTLDMKYFSDSKVGDLMSRFSSDASMINSIILDSFTIILYLMTAIFYLVVLFITDWKLTMGVFLIAPLLLVVVKRYSSKLKHMGKNRQEISGELNSKLQETLSGIRVIKAFTTENYEKSKFKNLSSKLRFFTRKAIGYEAKANSIAESLNYIMFALLLFFGGYRVIRSGGTFTPGDFMTVLAGMGAMYTPAKRALKLYNGINTNSAAVDRIFEILDIESKVIDSENATQFKEFNSTIEFKNVDFEYEENKNVITNFNLSVKKGEKIALVGNSGGGKSTIVNLLPRFYDVSHGTIEIDGVDIKKYKLKSLRKKIGIVPQDTFLFSGTIEENIKYGNRTATTEEVIDAAKQANAHVFIEKLSNGYLTEIGERGVKLSGGQKQRIAIARAILENPEILILDEATSALDNESEKLVQDALEKLMKDKTSFVIAHRLSTVISCDKIIVLQAGEIREIGTHAELLEKNGIYKSLYERNFDDKIQN